MLQAVQHPSPYLGLTFENLFRYSPAEHDLVSHLLSLGYAVQAAGLLYSLATSKDVASRFRLASTLSAVVSLSAALELYHQSQLWDQAFTFTGSEWVPAVTEGAPGARAFSDGSRYLSWSIDVPALLTQLLIVLGIKGRAFMTYWLQFVAAGLLMVYAGYVGQLYQVTSVSRFLIWGAVSTVLYVWLLAVAYRAVYGHLGDVPEPARRPLRGVFWLLVVSWTLYPVAYVMPLLWFSAGGAALKHLLFTVADVTSKVVYGVSLGLIAQQISALTGYRPSQVRKPA